MLMKNLMAFMTHGYSDLRGALVMITKSPSRVLAIYTERSIGTGFNFLRGMKV